MLGHRLFFFMFLSLLGLPSSHGFCATPNAFPRCQPIVSHGGKPASHYPNEIISPRSGDPAVVAWGDSFELLIRTLGSFSGSDSPGDWAVWLTTSAYDPWGVKIGKTPGFAFALKVEGVQQGSCTGTMSLTVNAGYMAPRDTYHLRVLGPMGIDVSSIYSVRLLGAKKTRGVTIAVIADHQLKDPSVKLGGGNLNNGAFPHLGDTDAESIMLQETSELSFFDPDLVLHLGDLVFGTDYKSEIPDTLHLWWQKPLGTLMVPGNHDGMALYRLSLRPGWYKDALHSLSCANKALSKDIDVYGVFSLLVCLYGDLKKMLFENLDQDGLSFWRRYIGPENFSLTLGKTRFVGLNSYSGSAQRRHGFALKLEAFGLDLNLGTAVDNYGGFLTPALLEWLRGEFDAAKKNKERVVLFLHHDPRGNEDSTWPDVYHPNLPFPTEPLGLRKFQEWNFEGNPDWDSDPEDGVSAETQKSNSAVSLLRLISSGVDLVLMGHAHVDRDRVYEPGEELVKGSGIRAAKRLRFTRVTTASAHPGDADGYWGYRMAEISKDGVHGLSWMPDKTMASVPAGNLWISGDGMLRRKNRHGLSDDLVYVVHNGLPRAVSGRLMAYLHASVSGWSFSTDSKGCQVRLEDMAVGQGAQNIYYLRVHVPAYQAKTFPAPKGKESTMRIMAHRASKNRVPVVDFCMSSPAPGARQEVVFDASKSDDPDGDKIISFKWDFGDGYTHRGKRVGHSFQQVGQYRVRLTVTDSHGAYSSYTKTVRVSKGLSCSSSASGDLWGLVLGLMLVAFLSIRKTRSR